MEIEVTYKTESAVLSDPSSRKKNMEAVQDALVKAEEVKAEEVKAEEKNVKNNEESDKSALASQENVDKESRKIRVLDRLLKFDIVENENEEGISTRKVVVSVVDEATGKVLRQIPPEDLKNEVDNLSKFIGILIDQLG